MAVKLSQSKYKFRDVYYHLSRNIQPVLKESKWFYFNSSLNISLSPSGIKVIYNMLSQTIITTKSDQ